MAKARTQFICQNCGTVHPRWVGKCEGCGQWNTIVEEDPMGGIGGGPGKTPKKGRPVALTTLSGEIEEAPRIATGISELDRATGGGFVRGSAVLIGGDPGIGKSTVLMQAAAALARLKHRVIYVSGEEAVAQVRLRAQRLGAAETDVLLAAETNVEDILATLSEGKRPDLVIIDSIQTLWSDIVDSAPGTVTQVRTGVQAMIRFAKQTGATVVLVGHVTKEGQIAGPRVVEHMVDAVLYFEGDGSQRYRVLRTVKNRFGPTDEVGCFDLSDVGIIGLPDPSGLFLSTRAGSVPGTCVTATLEGRRPLLAEVQALVTPSSIPTPRRATHGVDGSRIAMITAVLEKRAGAPLTGRDIYLSTVGGVRLREPAADLAMAFAMASAILEVPIDPHLVAIGEVGLAGEIRPVQGVERRLTEAARLRFSTALVPPGVRGSAALPSGIRVIEVPDIQAAVGHLQRVAEQPRAELRPVR